MEPFDRDWFGCCPSGHIPSDGHGIPTCNSNDVTRSALGLTQAASRWKQMRTHAPKRRECLPSKITWAQISSRDARFIFSLHAGAVVWPLFLDIETFSRCFDLGFHDQMAVSKSTTNQKGLSKYIMEPVCITKPYFEYMVQCEFHNVTAHITECVSNGKWAQNVFYAHFKMFLCWILLGNTQCRASVH